MKKSLLICLFFLFSNANAAVINFGTASVGGSGPLIEFNDLITPTTITGDAIFTLNVKGDLNLAKEYADLMLDDLDLGRILNNDSSDDLFDFINDEGNEQLSTITGTATISEMIFASLISDGFLDFSFDANQFVNFGNVEVSGSIVFSTVPEPTGFVLFVLGMIGLVFSRKMKPAQVLAYSKQRIK